MLKELEATAELKVELEAMRAHVQQLEVEQATAESSLKKSLDVATGKPLTRVSIGAYRVPC